MYYASTPYTPQKKKMFDLRCTIILAPGDPIGVALKYKLLYVAAYIDTEGFHLDHLSKFIAIVAWGISLSHSFAGKFVSHMHNPFIRCFLNVRVARSAYCAYGCAGEPIGTSLLLY